MKIKFLILCILMGFTTIHAQNADINSGLVAYYPFNGNANDESGNSNHGQVISTKLTKDRNGKPNSAYLFDGRNSYIKIPHSKSLDLTKDFTVSIWFKAYNLTKDPGGHHITLYRKGLVGVESSYALMFDVKDNIPKGFVTKLKINEWYNIIIVRQPSEKYSATYINGELISSGGAGYHKSNTLPIGIGASLYRGGAEDKFKGIIDDIMIYNKALNECELALLLNDNKNSLRQEALKFVEDNMVLWNKKDEYETSREYENRIKNKSKAKEDELQNMILDRLSKEINWKCGSKKYNADNQEFTLTFNDVEPFKISVPSNEARQFGDNFSQIEYINPQFSIGDGPNLILDCVTIKNPANGKEYKYGCKPVIKEEIPKDAVKVKSKTVTVKIWDDAKEDGDIVSVYLNDARIKKEITVKKSEHIFTLELSPGVNTFKLFAHNEGSISPNTAAILIDDGTEEYKRTLESKKDEFAELKIVLE